jgi:BolA protein
MSRKTRIETLLADAFVPSELTVTDDSARHAGHAGAGPEGETHFNVTIHSIAFIGLSRVAMQRAVMDALNPEFDSGLHALSIKASPPQ